MKVKVLKKFKDKYTGKIYKVGEVLNIKKERFEEILTKGEFVEKVEAEKADEKAEETAEK